MREWSWTFGSRSSFSIVGMGHVWSKGSTVVLLPSLVTVTVVNDALHNNDAAPSKTTPRNVVHVDNDKQEEEEEEEAGELDEEEEEEGEREGLRQEHDSRAVTEWEGSEWPLGH